jgi:hypothetical protein
MSFHNHWWVLRCWPSAWGFFPPGVSRTGPPLCKNVPKVGDVISNKHLQTCLCVSCQSEVLRKSADAMGEALEAWVRRNRTGEQTRGISTSSDHAAAVFSAKSFQQHMEKVGRIYHHICQYINPPRPSHPFPLPPCLHLSLVSCVQCTHAVIVKSTTAQCTAAL